MNRQDKSINLMWKIYDDLAKASGIIDFDIDPLLTERKYLSIIEDLLAERPEDLLLQALKAELLFHVDKNKSLELVKSIVPRIIGDESEKGRLAKGICFYIEAINADTEQKYVDSESIFYFFRQGLINFPNHWYMAAMFADHVYNDDAFYPEAIKHLDKAVEMNTSEELIINILSQAGHISHITYNDVSAVQYYEKLNSIREMNGHNSSRAALSYGRLKKFTDALKFFRQSWEAEKSADLTPVFRGHDAPELWDLTAKLAAEYEAAPTVDLLLDVAVCFKYLPAALSAFVIDAARKELTGRDDVMDFVEAFGKPVNTSYKSQIRFTETEFMVNVNRAIGRVNKRLSENSSGENQPIQLSLIDTVRNFSI